MFANHELLIAGDWQPASGGNTFPINNPATGQKIGVAASATSEDIKRAIDAAEAVMPLWESTSPWERSDILRKIAQNMRDRVTEIAELITLEIGKPTDQAMGEVRGSAEQFDWFADETRRILGQIVESRLPDTQHFVKYEPVGIVAAFSPWNFPVALAARKIAPALAAGCAVIVKGASEAPGATKVLIECCENAGLPAGTVSLLSGNADAISNTIMEDARVRKVSFTGSVPVGKTIAAAAAQTLKKVTMELGGHTPVIVMDDVDVAHVAKMSAQAKFRNCGQVCISPSRFLVMKTVADEYIREFTKTTEALKVANGCEDGADVGPLATEKRRNAIAKLVNDAMAQGATLATGGKIPEGMDEGYFYAPTVLVDVPDTARLMQEEIFGPIAAIRTVESLEEAIEIANNTEFGLHAYAFTASLRSAHKIADGLKCGMVTINSFSPAMTEVPFGGIKSSGYGREGGSLGIWEYLQSKSITLTL
ncbi:MAG: NAD-dependent succinate-semialdehyde dehydrogenase [Aestuariivita sp.]|nr:NAD-dependent succinate-semialdehyde dehydrogenase [Aestuariivita sp.]